MIIKLDETLEEPLYLQLRGQVIEAIARGELLPGDSLPSVRNLALELGINPNTVGKAYSVLRDEGYVLTRGRSGAFVAERDREAVRKRAAEGEERMAEALRALVLEHKARGGSEQQFLDEAVTQARDVYADPGVAGARRTINVLGLDARGERRNHGLNDSSGASTPVASGATRS